MVKTIAAGFLVFFMLGSCCREEPDIHRNEGKQWFEIFKGNLYVPARSKDSLVESFRGYVQRHEEDISNSACNREYSTIFVELNYDPSVYDNFRFSMKVEGFNHDSVLSFRGSYGSPYSYHFNEPTALYYNNENMGNCMRYIGDTSINGDSYNDVYRVSIPAAVNKGNLKDVIISVSNGLLQYETTDSTGWMLDPK